MYSVSKGAILTMTYSIAIDYVKKGIRCNCIAPARIHTPFVDGFVKKNYPGKEEEMLRKLSDYQPIGRMGRPDEVASLALFLCSDEAAFITGQCYPHRRRRREADLMKRIGVTIGLRKEALDEYKRIHVKLWPEIEGAIKEAGIRNYSIFYNDGQLFGYFEHPGPDAAFAAAMKQLAEAPAHARVVERDRADAGPRDPTASPATGGPAWKRSSTSTEGSATVSRSRQGGKARRASQGQAPAVKSPTPLGHRRGRWLVAAIPAAGLALAGIGSLIQLHPALGARRRAGPRAAPAAAAPTAAAPPATELPAAPPGAYDPTKLLDEGKNAGEVYLAEARDPAWADLVETVVGGRIRGDLERMVPGAGVVLHCRRLSCLVGIDAPAEKRDAAKAVSKFITLGPVTVDLDPEEDGTLRWLFFSEPRMGDAAAFTEWYKRLRKTTLAKIKEGKTPNPFPVPLEADTRRSRHGCPGRVATGRQFPRRNGETGIPDRWIEVCDSCPPCPCPSGHRKTPPRCGTSPPCTDRCGGRRWRCCW